MNFWRTIFIIFVLLVGVNGYFLLRNVLVNPRIVIPSAVIEREAYIMPVAQADYLPALVSSVNAPTLDAAAAIVYDVKSDKNLYEKNIDTELPIASLTKIMAAVVAWEHFSPNATTTVAASAVKVDGERQDLYVGEVISINSLLRMMLIESSNDAAYALRDYAATQGLDLVKAMNDKAASLDMTSTHYVDPAGLDDSGYSTADDLVKEVRYALRYDTLWDFSQEKTATVSSVDGKISNDIQSTDELLGVLPDIFGGKTGYTDGAKGCIMLIIDIPNQNDKMIAIVLGSDGRFDTMKQLVQWTESSYRWE